MKKLLMIGALVASSGAMAAPVQWTTASGGNGHWYDYVGTSVNWTAARSNALASSYSGMQGYLATVTSAAENQFLVSRGFGLAWIGGTDEWNAANETDSGIWKWMDGPEAGQTFFIESGHQSLMYTNWNGGEPNNCCYGEDYLQFSWSSTGGWNDHGGPGNSYQTNGYIVEYSAAPSNVPEPATLGLMGSALFGLVALRRRKSVAK